MDIIKIDNLQEYILLGLLMLCINSIINSLSICYDKRNIIDRR
jgi:uncharacterized protein YeeX (DUF496 family)